MVSIEFAEASSEINMIFEFLPKDYTDKVPKKLRSFFKEVASKDYVPKLNPTIDLEKQNLKEKTKDILAMLYMNYWCSDEQKAKFKNQLIDNDVNYENELKEKYNIDVFEDKNKMKQIEKEEKKENLSLKVNEERWYSKALKNIINWIKSTFKKNK